MNLGLIQNIPMLGHIRDDVGVVSNTRPVSISYVGYKKLLLVKSNELISRNFHWLNFHEKKKIFYLYFLGDLKKKLNGIWLQIFSKLQILEEPDSVEPFRKCLKLNYNSSRKTNVFKQKWRWRSHFLSQGGVKGTVGMPKPRSIQFHWEKPTFSRKNDGDDHIFCLREV